MIRLMQKEISYRLVKDTPQLRLEFPFPDTREWWKTKVSDGHPVIAGPAHLYCTLSREDTSAILLDTKGLARSWQT